MYLRVSLRNLKEYLLLLKYIYFPKYSTTIEFGEKVMELPVIHLSKQIYIRNIIRDKGFQSLQQGSPESVKSYPKIQMKIPVESPASFQQLSPLSVSTSSILM